MFTHDAVDDYHESEFGDPWITGGIGMSRHPGGLVPSGRSGTVDRNQ